MTFIPANFRRLRFFAFLFSAPLLFLFLFFFQLSPTAFAGSLHPLRFDHISIKEGLPSTGIFSFHQTNTGFVLIGTSNGLVRYDGRQMFLYPSIPENKNTLSHSRVLSMYEDQNQMLWVGTRLGLDRFDLTKETIERMSMPEAMESKSRAIYGIVQTSNKKIWLASAGGLLVLDTETAKIRPWSQSNIKQLHFKSEMSAIVTDRKGGIWFGQGHELINIDANEQIKQRIDLSKFASEELGNAESVVRSLNFTEQAELWVGLAAGVFKFELERATNEMQIQKLPVELSLPKGKVSAMLVDRDKSMWFALGDDRGLFRWNSTKKTLENFVHKASISTSLSGNSLTSLMLDRSGSLWVGTTDYGVNLVDVNRKGFTAYLHSPEDPQSLSHPLVSAVLPDGNDFVWVGTLGGGLNRVNLKNGDVERIPYAQVGGYFIRTLMRDVNNKIWIGAEDLLLFDPVSRQSRSIFPKQIFPVGARFTSIVQDQKGNIWAGTSVGLYKIKKEGGYSVFRSDASKKGGLNDDAIDSLLIDREQRLWVGSKGALFLFDLESEQFKMIGFPNPSLKAVEKLGVTAIKQDRQGRIWAATLQGLLEVQPRNKNQVRPGESEWELIVWNRTIPLPDDVMEAMQDASNGDLWISSERGLTRLQMKDRKVWNFPSFDYFEGPFNFAAAARSQNGNLHFGGVGLVSFHPDRILPNSTPPQIVLSDILLFNQSLSMATKLRTRQLLGQAGPMSLALDADKSKQEDLASVGINGPLYLAKRIHLDHTQSMLGFELSSLHFYNHSQNSYAWMLRGYDKNWIRATMSQGIATYTNLDPGVYTLYAKAANPDGVWGAETKILEIEVLPPYWRTSWWYISWAIVIFILSAWLYRRRVMSIRQNEVYLAEQIKQQTQEILSQKQRADQQRELAEHARNDIRRLSEIGLQINAHLDVRGILDTLYQNIRSLIDVSTVGVGFVDWSKRHISFEYTMQGDKKILPYYRSLDAVDQPASQCVLQGKEFILESIVHDCSDLDEIAALESGKLFTVLEDGTRTEDAGSAIYVPIKRNGQAVAVIGVLNKVENAFSKDDLHILRTLATYTAVAWENAQTYKQLEMTQSKLVEQEKMAALGSLVAGVAHELNTPIGNGLLIASSIQDYAGQFVAQVRANNLRRSELEHFCDTTISASTMLVKNISIAANLVTSFKQIAVDQTSDQRRIFNLSTFCDDVSHTLFNRVKLDGHTLNLNIPEHVELDSYPGSMGQVLTNLIINAIVHGFDGRENGVINVSSKLLENDCISLSVSDNGHGISAENRSRIFEPFFTTRLGSGGSGLGLHICYNIVSTILGGSIEVESQLGVGSTFTIIIPRVAP
jgi:ligand-binding sensor domain-containing protein/signal transduction histidine kinase